MTIRTAFVEHFSEDIATSIEQAAESHKNGVHDNAGSDYFRWALLICIGHECVTRFREDHSLEALDPEELGTWCRVHKDELQAHDGDVDYISLMTGAYNYWLGLEGA